MGGNDAADRQSCAGKVRAGNRGKLRLRLGIDGGRQVGEDLSSGVLRREAPANHGFDFRPEMGVAFTLHVAGSNPAIEPGSCGTANGMLAVIDQIISEDFGAMGIGGDDVAAAMNEAVGLKKVDGLIDVGGDDGVVLPKFSDAIDLDGEQDGHAFALQIAG